MKIDLFFWIGMNCLYMMIIPVIKDDLFLDFTEWICLMVTKSDSLWNHRLLTVCAEDPESWCRFAGQMEEVGPAEPQAQVTDVEWRTIVVPLSSLTQIGLMC